MIPDRKQVRVWRGRVRHAVKQSPRLNRLRRSVGKRRSLSFNPAGARWIAPLAAFSFGISNAELEVVLPAVLLWTLLVTFSRARHLVDAMSNPQVLWIPFTLPVESGQAFRFQWQGIVRSAGWLSLDWLGLGLGAMLHQPEFAGWFWVPLLALVQAVVALATAVWLVRIAPRLPYALCCSVTWMLLILCYFLIRQPWFAANIWPQVGQVVTTVTPGGWIASLATMARDGAIVGWVGLVVVAVGAAWAVREGSRRLAEAFSMEDVFDLGADEVMRDQLEEDPDEVKPAIGPVDVEALRTRYVAVCERTTADELASQGLVERWVIGRLSRRQRGVVGVMRPRSVTGWARGWMIAFGVVLILRLMQFVGLPPHWAAIASAVTVGLFALPLFGGQWAGFEGMVFYARRVGLQSVYPVGFGECARLMLRVSFLRSLIALPLLVLVFRVDLEELRISWLEAVDYGARVVVFVLAMQTVWVIHAFSKSTNDTSVRWWFTLLLVAVIFIGILVFVTGIVVGAMVGPGGAWLALGSLLLFSQLVLWGYGWVWGRRFLDTIAIERSTA